MNNFWFCFFFSNIFQQNSYLSTDFLPEWAWFYIQNVCVLSEAVQSEIYCIWHRFVNNLVWMYSKNPDELPDPRKPSIKKQFSHEKASDDAERRNFVSEAFIGWNWIIQHNQTDDPTQKAGIIQKWEKNQVFFMILKGLRKLSMLCLGPLNKFNFFNTSDVTVCVLQRL